MKKNKSNHSRAGHGSVEHLAKKLHYAPQVDRPVNKAFMYMLVLCTLLNILRCEAYSKYFVDDATASNTIATSTFDPVAGSYATAQNVTIFSTTNGATLLYTTEGSTPTHTDGTPTGTTAVYTTTINVTATTTLKTIAYKSGMTDSAVATAVYTITPTYTIGGSVSGLSGTLVLQNNGIDDLTLTADGSFSFATKLADTGTYNITIYSDPPAQTCTVSSGSGTVSSGDISDITLNCIDDVTAPTLLSSTPADVATSIAPCSDTPCTGKIILVFSESMNTGLAQTLTTEIYNGSYVAALNAGTTFSYSTTTSDNDTLTINFSGSWYRFPENSQIRYTLDATGIKDVANNQIAANVQRSFTTTMANQSFAVADTGQTLCYNASATQGCSDASWPRQDADYVDTPNARSFTGPTPDATYTSDYTTVDNVTTLVWKSCTEGLSGSGCTGTASTMTWYNALNQCAALNAMNSGAGYAARTQWRLPTFGELKTIPNYNATNPSIDVASFPATVANYYWSSSTYVGSLNNAWIVNFFVGDGYYSSKISSNSVRCVTTGLVTTKTYTDNADNTITDTTTNLRWQKCSRGQTQDATCSGSATIANWQVALQYCDSLTLGTGSPIWRLPSINELKSLVDDSVSSPSIKTTNFPATVAGFYWSSSTYVGSNAWNVNFSDGYSSNIVKTTSLSYYVRCVTTGP